MIAQQSRECIWPTLKMAVDFPDEMEVVAIPVSILVFLLASTFSLLLFGTACEKHCARSTVIKAAMKEFRVFANGSEVISNLSQADGKKD